MRTRKEPLLCELHAHTTWSDGVLSLPQLVDLHGMHGFDVLCVTDHTLRPGDPVAIAMESSGRHVHEAAHPSYLAEIESEAERARALYGLLVIPGLELTYNDLDPLAAGHALALGLRSFAGVACGLDEGLRAARSKGAAIIAAHPHSPGSSYDRVRTTQRFASDWRDLVDVVDRYELFNRSKLFPWVAEEGLLGVASGDFHRPEQLSGWKSLLPCSKEEEAVVSYLRSSRPVYLVRLDAPLTSELAA